MRFITLTLAVLLLPAALLALKAPAEVRSQAEIMRDLSRNMDFWINSPLITDDAIIFFFREKAEKVLVATSFNDWKPELLMEEKGTNFYQYIWDKRLKKGTYHYKLMVNDIWMNDPNNTNTITDDSGQLVSTFTLEEDFTPYARYPLWLEKDWYEFRYEDPKAQNAYVVGDFNNWNPFSHQMKPLGAGEFSLKVRLKPGLRTYCFVVDGDWKTDPNNLNQYSDEAGSIISVLFVPERNKKKK